MEVRAGHNGDEISWSFGSCKNKPGGYNDNSTTEESCCDLTTSKAILTCRDSGDNGWEGGSIVIKGKRYCDDKSWLYNPSETAALIDLGGII